MADVGKLGLEALMSRANILFCNGYKFRGDVNFLYLKESYHAIVSCVNKFNYQLDYVAQNNFEWNESSVGVGVEQVQLMTCSDVDLGFRSIVSTCYELSGPFVPSAMELIVIISDNSDELILTQICSHVYFDARSAEVIFNKIIEYYNALVNDAVSVMESIVESARQLHTISSNSMLRLLGSDQQKHLDNIDALACYPIADEGKYGVTIENLPAALKQYQWRDNVPIIQCLNISKVVEHCRQRFPDVSKNSVICAVIAEALYNININFKNKPTNHIISGKMLSDLLTPKQHQSYVGNYIAFVPCSVEGSDGLAEKAQSINERIRQFKSHGIDESLFRCVEEAASANMMGLDDEDLSYIVTNWTNYTFLNRAEYLTGCRSIQHLCGVNIDPKDCVGAALVNRPVIVISLSGDAELCLSYFPSLRSDLETQQIADQIRDIVNSY